MFDHGRVVVEYLVCIGLRAPSGREPLHRQEVDRRIRNTVQRTAVVAALELFFRCLCLFEGNLRGQAGVGVKAGSELLTAVEICLSQIDGREFFRFDAFREFAYREIENLFARHLGMLLRDSSAYLPVLVLLALARASSPALSMVSGKAPAHHRYPSQTHANDRAVAGLPWPVAEYQISERRRAGCRTGQR